MKVDTSAGALNFLLDSGASSSVLNLEAMQRLGVTPGERTRVQRVGEKVAACRVKDFHGTLAGIPLGPTPLAMDLSATSATCSHRIDGLVGQDFFRGKILQIDFKKQELRLLDHTNPTPCCAVLRLRLDHQALCVPLSVNGSSIQWTRLDTGCDDALHWVGHSGHGDRDSVKLGEEQVDDVKVAWHAREIFPDEAGLLGNGVLSNYRVTIDTVAGRVLLQRS